MTDEQQRWPWKGPKDAPRPQDEDLPIGQGRPIDRGEPPWEIRPEPWIEKRDLWQRPTSPDDHERRDG